MPCLSILNHCNVTSTCIGMWEQNMLYIIFYMGSVTVVKKAKTIYYQWKCMFSHNLQSCVKGNSSKFLYNKSYKIFNPIKYRFSKGISYLFLFGDVINQLTS
jgi:hypothetical protein